MRDARLETARAYNAAREKRPGGEVEDGIGSGNSLNQVDERQMRRGGRHQVAQQRRLVHLLYVREWHAEVVKGDGMASLYGRVVLREAHAGRFIFAVVRVTVLSPGLRRD